MFKKILSDFPKITFTVRHFNANTASITKIHRNIYARTYPTIMVLADGSTINIRYHEPRKIIKMPLDLSLLSDDERKERLERRKPKVQMKVEEDFEDSFNSKKYLSFMKDSPKKR